MSICNILNLRYNWEQLVSGYKMEVDNNGTINNLEWFIENGHTNNRFRPGFDEALEIAKTIVGEFYVKQEKFGY